MSLLGALGVIAATAFASEMGNAYGKNAYKNLDDKEFDKERSRYGIMHEFSTTQIYKIAARNRVRVDKYGILPEHGYRECLDYVNKYSLNKNDTKLFIDGWEQTIKIAKEDKKKKIIKDNEKNYERQRKNAMKYNMDPEGPEVVLEYRHWFDLSPEEYHERLNKLYTETFLGEIAIEKPILRYNPGNIYNPYIETWVLRGEKGQDPDFTNVLKASYSICCKKLGFLK